MPVIVLNSSDNKLCLTIALYSFGGGIGMHWVQLFCSIMTLFSGIMTIFSFISKDEGSKKRIGENCTFKVRFVTFLVKQRVRLLITFFAFLFATAFVLVPEFYPNACNTPHPTPIVTVTPPATPMPVPSITPTPEDSVKKLNELDPLIINEQAFLINKWDDYTTFRIGSETYTEGIGIQIPLAKQKRYCEENRMKNTDHSEFIEYSLSYQYKKLECDLGLDQTTFENTDRTKPSGLCKIVFQDAKSDDFLREDESVLYKTDWFNYRQTKLHIPVDLNGVGTLRITVYWEYNPDPTKQNCFNLAIVDPILYLKKT